MSHRGEVSVKIEEAPSASSSANKSKEEFKPPRLAAGGPSPRLDEGRLSPRKSQSLTPRKNGPDEHREKNSTTPRKNATQGDSLQPLKKETKAKSGFLASFFGDAQPSPAQTERLESSPNPPKVLKKRPGSASMTADQMVSVREAAAADTTFGRSSSSGIVSPEPAKDSPRGKQIGFVASPTAPTTGSSVMKDPWKAKQVKSANAALSGELQLLQQYKLRERHYARQTNAATPFKYLELNPEDVEVLLKTPRSASSASSGGSSSGLTEHAAEVMKLDPTSWAKWHIEMSDRLKQRKAEAAAQLAKSQRVRVYNLDAKGRPGTLAKKLPSSSAPGTGVIASASSSAVGSSKEKRRESESDTPLNEGNTSPRGASLSAVPSDSADRRSKGPLKS